MNAVAFGVGGAPGLRLDPNADQGVWTKKPRSCNKAMRQKQNGAPDRKPSPMTDATTGDPDSAYDALAQAKELLRSVRAGALATLVPGNAFPFASLVNVATAPDGSPILLLSRLAAHTRHLASDPRLSLLLVQTGAGDPLAHPRVTIMGTGECVIDPDGRAALKARFLARHPESALYADFADFSFWRVVMEQAHLNGGFARAGHFKAAASSPHRSTARKPWSRPNRKRLPR